MGTRMNTNQSSYLLQIPSTLTNLNPRHHIKSNPLSSERFPNNNPTIKLKTQLINPIFSSFSSSGGGSSTNNKEQKWVHEGTISESLPNGMFWVNCDNGDVILGYVSGKMRRGSIRILPGDRVKVEVSRYDSTRGRIIYRTRA